MPIQFGDDVHRFRVHGCFERRHELQKRSSFTYAVNRWRMACRICRLFFLTYQNYCADVLQAFLLSKPNVLELTGIYQIYCHKSKYYLRKKQYTINNQNRESGRIVYSWLTPEKMKQKLKTKMLLKKTKSKKEIFYIEVEKYCLLRFDFFIFFLGWLRHQPSPYI